MKKALNITLNNILFSIEEDAYERLRSYLESIKKTFTDSEIIADIEARIAEQFQVATHRKAQAVTMAEVESVIRSMGTSEDIASDEPRHQNEYAARPLKKLYRDTDNKIIAGVAGGLAAYFGIDALYIRIIFAVFTLFSGLGIAIYVLLWLIVPEAQTISQKMEMQGDPVTLKNLEEAVKARVETDKQKLKTPAGTVAQFFAALFSLLGTLFSKIIPALRTLIGVLFTFAGSVGCVAATVAILGFLVNVPDPRMDPDFIRFIVLIGERYFPFAAAAAYAVVVIPMIIIFLAGISMLRKKNTASGPTLAVLISIWMAAVITIGVTLAYIIPRFEPGSYNNHRFYFEEREQMRNFDPRF